MKARRGRPPKKKTVEEIPEIPSREPEVIVASANGLSCECGEEAVPGSHQCWNCSHRA